MNKKQDKDKTFVKLYNYFVVDFVTQIFNPKKIMIFYTQFGIFQKQLTNKISYCDRVNF